MSNIITIDPITRLEGHGKITIVLDDNGDLVWAFFQIPELRGFEAFCVGRAAEDMPQITSRICGVCPSAHHMAATKTLDSLFEVEPTPTAKAIRELFYNLFMFEDHTIIFIILVVRILLLVPTHLLLPGTYSVFLERSVWILGRKLSISERGHAI